MEGRLREALNLTDNFETIERCLVETQQAADAFGFAGSPSILIDGRDPFPSSSGDIGLMCRVYYTPEGPAGAPTVEQLVAAIGRIATY